MASTPPLSLRARKQAQTKLALMNALIARLDDRNLDEIPVKELYEAADISEASFFNYFARKADIIVYFIQLWSLDLAWQLGQADPERPVYEAIAEVYVSTARQTREHPGLMREILAQQARQASPSEPFEITLAERLIAFPDRPGIAEVPALGLDSLFPPLVERAIATGELPPTTDPTAAFLGLSTIFLGVPMCLTRSAPEFLEAAYRQQLALFWRGLKAADSPR